jgi:hypothetical protein
MEGSQDSKHDDSLQLCRVGFCKLLPKVRVTILAIGHLTARHFSGLIILFKSDANALNDLGASATHPVNYYNGHADDLR